MKATLKFDIGTLLVAEMLICLVFAFVLFIFANRFRQLRGTSHIAFGFLAGAASVLLLLSRVEIPLVLSVVLGNGMLMLAYMLLYAGTTALLGIRPRLRSPVAIAIVTLAAAAYFTVWHNDIAVRIILLSAANFLIELNFVADLIHYPSRSLVVRLVTISLLLSMLTDVLRSVGTAISGAPANFLDFNLVQLLYVATGIFSSCGLGIFSMALVTREVTAAIERSARRDSLTGALNRLGIEELLAVELQRSRRTLVPLSLALLDIDQFKAFNDTGGHAAGDDVLRNVAASIARHLRPYDVCGRIGGDEFLVLLPGSTALDIAAICDRILREVAALPPHFASGITPTVSIGFTEADSADLAADLLARADRALYAAKQQGRNCAQMELAPIRTLPSQLPPTPPPARRSRFRRAASSIRGSRS